jgi:competence transcription factor ComK
MIKYVYDIETLACMFDAGFYDFENDNWIEFEISERKNDIYSFVKFYNNKNIEIAIGYNNISFDSQVLEYIIKEYDKWFDLNGLEIANKIYQFTQKLIENQKYMFYRPYKNLSVNQLDCFTILGLDNIARLSSLKKCQFQLDYHNVEDMPIHHSITSLTDKEKNDVILYRKNDVLSTLEVYKLILGETEQKAYQGKNQLTLRENIEKEFGLNCKNFSDIKIGDELLKMKYAQEKKIPVNELPKKGTFRKWVHLSKGIPDYVEFKTEKLQKVLEELKTEKVSAYVKKHDRKITLKGTCHVIGLGGIHSTNKGEIYKEDENHLLIDLDVAGMYPAIICGRGYYPAHLGESLLNVYSSLFKQRLKLKAKPEKNFNDKVAIDGIKLILNSFYG